MEKGWNAEKKVCRKCNQTLSLSSFYKDSRYSSGYRNKCKSCHYKTHKLWVSKNRIKINQRMKTYRDINPDLHTERVRSWRKNNLSYDAFRRSVRRAATLKATPLWSNTEKIKLIYKRAKILSQELGLTFHVDHIIPLKHNLVCGLHVPDNLQILEAGLNLRKRNIYATI